MARKQNMTAYHLIDEEIHYPGRHEESGWDTDHRGAGQFYEPTREFRSVKSVNTIYPTFRKRNITEETEGVLTFECAYQIVSGDGFYLGFWGNKGDECEAFVLRQNDGKMYAGEKALFDIDNAWHYLKLSLDIDKGEVKVHNDGKFVCDASFTGPASTICRLQYGYDEKDLGEANIHADLKLYKNYLFNDQLICHFDGDMPEEYVISYDGNAKATRRRYNPASKYAIYDLTAEKGSKTEIVRSFDRAKGVVGYEMKYNLPSEGGKLTVSLMSAGEEVVSIYDEFTEIRCKDGALRSHSKNVWQTLRIEADTATNTSLIRLNGKAVTTIGFDIEAEYIDAVKIAFLAENDASLLFTELKAFPIPPLPSDYVPEPVIPKKKGDYYVGMNICSLWRSGTHYGWDCITPFKENKPYLGYYDEGIPETADWELKWMAEHGLDFQLYCWYGSESSMPMVKTMLSKEIYDGHMLAKYSDKVKIALLWEADSMCPQSFDDFKNYFAPLFIDYFFSDERYMQIDGVAIMSIYSPNRLAKQFGGPEVAKQAFDYLREEVKKLGYRDLAIMCCGESNPFYKECGIDAVHAYNLGHKGYDLQFTKDYNMNNSKEGSVHAVPTVSMGYNWVGWTGERLPVLEPSDMVEALEWAKEEIVDKVKDKSSWKSKLLMLSTWNEYGEGTFMMPAGVHGFGYLDALRTVFREDVPHADIVPNSDQLDRICILHPKDRATIAPLDTLPKDTADYGLIKRYEFKTEEDLALWEMDGPFDYELKDGLLVGHSHGQNPTMTLKDDSFLPISTEKIGRIVATIRTSKPVDAMDIIQHKYKFSPDEWFVSEPYTYSNPKEITRLTIEPSKIKGIPWHQTLYGFRFDPVWGVGDFELEAIEFYAQKPHHTLKVNGNIIDLCQTPYVEDNISYIPFDTKSEFKKIPEMYYEWDEEAEMLTVFGKKIGSFIKDCDVASVDGVDVKLAKPVTFVDGIPHMQADILADILGMELTVDELYISLNNK